MIKHLDLRGNRRILVSFFLDDEIRFIVTH
jgi:hypothetical protein